MNLKGHRCDGIGSRRHRGCYKVVRYEYRHIVDTSRYGVEQHNCGSYLLVIAVQFICDVTHLTAYGDVLGQTVTFAAKVIAYTGGCQKFRFAVDDTRVTVLNLGQVGQVKVFIDCRPCVVLGMEFMTGLLCTYYILVGGLVLQQGDTVLEGVAGYIAVGLSYYTAAVCSTAYAVGNGAVVNYGRMAGGGQ